PAPRLALHADPPAVCLDDATRDGQSEAGTCTPRALRLPERLEEVRELLLRDPRPGVRDAEDDLVVAAFGAHRHPATPGRELDRVVDQVGEDLEDAVVVGRDGREDRKSVV